jgi:cobalamin synthase
MENESDSTRVTMTRRQSAIPQEFRVFAFSLVGVLGVLAVLLVAAPEFFDLPQLTSNRELVIEMFSIIAAAGVLPVAVFMSLKRAASASRAYRTDQFKYKEETRRALYTSLIPAAAGSLAVLVWLWRFEAALPIRKSALAVIAVALPVAVWAAMYFIYERTFEKTRRTPPRKTTRRRR